MNAVDTSGWLEYFVDGPNASFFSDAIEKTTELIVPTISLYEVFKRIQLQRDEGDALQAVAVMLQGKVVDLIAHLAFSAAQISLELGIPMADSIILATASASNAVLWTQDSDFSLIPEVRYIAKQKS